MAVTGVDEMALSYVARFGKDGYRELLQAGITGDHFDVDYRNVWGFMARMVTEHDTVPSVHQLETRFSHFRRAKPRRADLQVILEDLKKRHKYVRFLTTATDVASSLGDGWDRIDEALEQTIATYTSLLNEGGNSQRLLDLFSDAAKERLTNELHNRRQDPGIPTGLVRLDAEAGGLHAGNMVVAIGRSGQGKSWVTLFLVAQAIIHGHKVALFPLEMTLWEVASRLYAIFSALLAPKRLIRAGEMSRGLITQAKLHRFMDFLKDRYEGRLYVSDTGQSHDPYTLERIMAEVEGLRPDMFWIDYLTLLKQPAGAEGWEAVQRLSRGIKHIAMKVGCVGGCSAQVNRAAIQQGVFLPRLEHIAFGDSIGHEADLVLSLAKPRSKPLLYWALVKHRHGPEIPRQKMDFLPDEGVLREASS